MTVKKKLSGLIKQKVADLKTRSLRSGFFKKSLVGFSQRASALKYVIDRKTVDNWVTSHSHNNMRANEITEDAMIDTKEEPKVRVLSQHMIDLTKELEKAKLTIVVLQTIINEPCLWNL